MARNDPSPPSGLVPARVQGNWGEAVYSVYGMYTSYNGAIAAWVLVDARL